MIMFIIKHVKFMSGKTPRKLVYNYFIMKEFFSKYSGK